MSARTFKEAQSGHTVPHSDYNFHAGLIIVERMRKFSQKLQNAEHLAIVDRIPEEVVEKKIGQILVLVVGGLDVAQEDRPDDATSTPHQCNAAIVLDNRSRI